MILRDRNHASLIMWSIGNEVDYPNDPYSHPILDHANINQPVHGGYQADRPNAERLGEIAKRLAAVVRSLDTSRPVTAAFIKCPIQFSKFIETVSNLSETQQEAFFVWPNHTSNDIDSEDINDLIISFEDAYQVNIKTKKILLMKLLNNATIYLNLPRLTSITKNSSATYSLEITGSKMVLYFGIHETK